MAGSTITYKCPNCDAGLLFNAEKQRFSCEFCLSDFTAEELLETASAERAKRIEEDNAGFASEVSEYHCQSCGAEIIADKTTVADFCYYCHNPIVLADKVTGAMRPTKIIPFKFDKTEAKDIFLRFAKKHKFVPKDYFSDAHADKITGIYYPFWVTDADTDSTLDTKARRVRTWRSGNYRYTETSHYSLTRNGKIHFEDITSVAISDEDQKMLEGILPYPTDAYINFDMPYLHGYFAKKRNIEREDLTATVRSRMDGYASTLLHGTIHGYTTVDSGDTIVRIDSSHWEYSLMPIWILTYRHEGRKKTKTYTYAMNGNTGKIYGELPISIPKLSLLFAGIATALTATFSLIGGLLL